MIHVLYAKVAKLALKLHVTLAIVAVAVVAVAVATVVVLLLARLAFAVPAAVLWYPVNEACDTC